MVLNLPTEATEITTAFIGITPAKLNGSNKSWGPQLTLEHIKTDVIAICA